MLLNIKKIDLVHANSIKAGLMAGVATKFAGKPLIWHIRDYYPDGWIRKFIRLWGKLFAHRIVSISQKVADMFEGLSFVAVVYNAVDLDLFSLENVQKKQSVIRSELGIPHDICLIGMVGQFAPWKGQKIYLKVAKEIVKKHSNTQFVLVGDVYHEHQTHYREQLISYVKEQQLDEKILFLGWRKDIVGVMSAIDILVHPAKDEPFGRVLIEAMAAGKPVIGVNSGALPEIIVPHKTGLLVPSDNLTALAEAINELVTNDELRGEMGYQSRLRVESLFSFLAHTKKILNIYNNLYT